MPVVDMRCPKCKETHPVYVPPRGDLPGPCGTRPKAPKDYTTCPVCYTETEAS